MYKRNTLENKQVRRKLLTALTVGGVAATNLKVLPEKWTRPVVEAVVLPAHAGTSCDALAIPDIFSNCTAHNTQVSYYIDDDGLCPMVVLGDPPSGPAEVFNIGSFLNTGIASINMDPSQPGGTTFSVDCSDGTLDPGSESAGAIPTFNVTSTSGIDYAFSGTYNNLGTGTGASATGMSFTLAP